MGQRANILLIISDQHHPGFMGCAGHPLVQTPHLDGLAADGMLFRRAFCNSPLCVPSRMAFLTGRRASELDCLQVQDELHSGIPTFAHAFGAAGYETILCGRMHCTGAMSPTRTRPWFIPGLLPENRIDPV